MSADPRLVALGILSGLAIAWPIARLFWAARKHARRR